MLCYRLDNIYAALKPVKPDPQLNPLIRNVEKHDLCCWNVRFKEPPSASSDDVFNLKREQNWAESQDKAQNSKSGKLQMKRNAP